MQLELAISNIKEFVIFTLQLPFNVVLFVSAREKCARYASIVIISIYKSSNAY